ncbi:MAG: metal ABC transporter permease [Alcaligenaceae bacterium]|nr:metal ABC transporter permease [Alcaligenaceae bacterium]
MYSIFIEPFISNANLQNILIAGTFLSLSAGPIGLFLIMKRLSLVADALSHGILPGIAIAFLLSSASILWMTIGGIIAGCIVAMGASWIARNTTLQEDHSFSVLYLISLSLGLLLISLHGEDDEHLMHILFGSAEHITQYTLYFMASISIISITLLTLLQRGLVIDSVDPLFMRQINGKGGMIHSLFLILFVLNLVAGFQILGTILVIGMMLLPATTSKLCFERRNTQMIGAIAFGIANLYVGLLTSYHLHTQIPATIILISGVVYLISLTFTTLRKNR